MTLLALLPITAGASSPSDTRHPRQAVTVDYLYEACSVVGETANGEIPYFDCESYVYGVLDGYLKSRALIPKGRRACFPARIEPWRVLELALPASVTTPPGQNAASYLIQVLRKRFPCP